MTGYEEFQRIMAELNYKVKHKDSNKISDDDVLKSFKDIFGI